MEGISFKLGGAMFQNSQKLVCRTDVTGEYLIKTHTE